MSNALELIERERSKQIHKHGYQEHHDDEHDSGELAMAAVCYATPYRLFTPRKSVHGYAFVDPWPWDEAYDNREYDGNVLTDNCKCGKRKRLRQLAKAGALIVAEMERIQRL